MSSRGTAAHERFKVRSYVVDDRAGLDQVLALGSRGMEITVRFKLGHRSAVYDFGSKFGAGPEEAVALLEQAKRQGVRTSLTFHPGSQCADPLAYADHLAAASQIAQKARVSLYRLNVGGGFPVTYEHGSMRRVEDFFGTIRQGLDRYFAGARPELLCEPGRALVASSVSLVAEVVHVRKNGDVFMNDGVYGGFQEQTIMKTPLPTRVWRAGRLLASPRAPRNIFGPPCDPLDRLSVPFSLPVDIQPGDGIEFGLMGAYGSATTTCFNGIQPGDYVSVQNGFTGC
ncbi:MAG: type III PLP-dependent enzyme [Gammaproteobacteria bacterium]|nr:type III PLP-dependent enzyme [Gammaproteobacteria bacterium]